MAGQAEAAVADVDVVVVAYNSGDTLRACVEPLAGDERLSVTVVDNASPKGGLETLEGLDVRAVAAGENRGFAAGCNLGWRLGCAPAVLFLNPDARIEPEDVVRLARRLEDPGVGIAAPRIVGEDGVIHHSLRRFPSVRSTFAQALFAHRVLPDAAWSDEVVRDADAYEAPHAVDWASGACLLVRRTLLEQLGGLDDGFFMYCEDTDLCKRAADAGAATVYEPDAAAVHLGGASAPRASLLPVLASSRCRYAAKHGPAASAVLTRVGVVLGAFTHAVVSRDGAARSGQLRAARVAIRAATDPR